MGFTTLMQIKQELVVFLRNQDLISNSDRGVTTSTDTGTFTATASHTLATNPTLVKNIRSVTVAGSPLYFGDDYFVNYSTGVISFNNPQTGAYSIVYDQGSSDRIFPDFPQPYLKLSSFPRISVDVIGGVTSEIELGAGTNYSEYPVTIVAYDKDLTDMENLISGIRQKIMENKKNFYYFKFITPTAMGPVIVSPFGEQKILQRNQDFLIRFVYDSDDGN